MTGKLVILILAVAAGLLLFRVANVSLPGQTQKSTAPSDTEDTASRTVERPLTPPPADQPENKPVTGEYSYKGTITAIEDFETDKDITLETEKDNRTVHFLITDSTVIQESTKESSSTPSSIDKLAVGQVVTIVASYDASVGQYGTWTTLGVVINSQ